MSLFFVVFYNIGGFFTLFMYNNTIGALEIILGEAYDTANPAAALLNFIPASRLLNVKKNQTILYKMDPAKYLYMLLSGRAVIMNDISWNNDNIIDYVESPHILGLIEPLNGVDHYTAFVIAQTDCILFRILTSEFMTIIQRNPSLCFKTLVIMGKIAHSNMGHAESHKIFSSKDILGHYLYLRAQYAIPYICSLTRTALAEELHINLRTLYRYIGDLEKKNCLAIQKGKIVIEQEHLNNLAIRYQEIIL